MKKLFSFLITLLYCGSASADATADFAYSPQWLALVHYQKEITGYKGTIGSANFYLSHEGRTDPQKELNATVALFNSDDDKTKCMFPARYLRLKQNGLINADFPICEEYAQFKKDLRPSGVTLLFTDAYMNNSSSLFGHTLVRVDTARKGTQLLAHGINYGAWTRGYENSFLYAVYGLAGFYPGGYTVKPYYDVINTYNNLENRDIWEYNLNFSAEELDLFVAHIWEVGQTTTPYYFFTQNCSYMLMEVFDAVRPELKLAQSFPVQTIPLDTIKAVVKREGLVSGVYYRPSRQRKIRYRMEQMNKPQFKAFLKATKLNLAPTESLPEEEQADVLETAYQYIQYQYVANEITLQDYRKKSFELLKARNKVKAGQKFDELKTGNNPAYAHDSMQASFGIGNKDGDVYQEIRYRPAYHSLIDNGFGFLRGAEINFLDIAVRHYDKRDRYVLQQINVLELASLSPIDEVFKAVSYKVGVNVTRQTNPKTEEDYYALNANVNGGGTYALTDNLWIYGLTGLDAAYGGGLPHNQWVGTDLIGGILFNSELFGGSAEIKKVFATDKIGSTLTYSAVLDYYVTRNAAVEAKFTHTQNYGKNFNESLLKLKYNF